jgi:hypothetical protein
MDDRRIFSEQEAANLIVNAAKLQESDGEGAKYSAGVTWEELQRMAGDVGVDPEYLRKALAGSVPANPVSKPREFLGMPLSQEFERVVDAEIAPENFDVIASEFYNPGYGGGGSGSHYSGYGGPSIIGRMMKGQFYEGMAYGSMEVSSRHGRTRIKARSSNAIGVWAIWFPIAMLAYVIALIVTATSDGALALPALGSATAVTAFLWASIGAGMRQSIAKIPEKLDRIAQAVLDESEFNRETVMKSSAGIEEPDMVRENLSRE